MELGWERNFCRYFRHYDCFLVLPGKPEIFKASGNKHLRVSGAIGGYFDFGMVAARSVWTFPERGRLFDTWHGRLFVTAAKAAGEACPRVRKKGTKREINTAGGENILK